MTTCEPLPDGGAINEPLTLFAVDSLASPSVRPGKSLRRLMNGGSGQPSRTSFASYDPATCSWRTSRVSLDGEWETFSGTCNNLEVVVARRIWPTPMAADSDRSSETFLRGNETLLGAARMWPTPKGSAANYGRPRGNDRGDLQAAILMWPTPRASNAKQCRLESHHIAATGGQLNPTWVEWLMGYPEGWTDCGD